LGLCGSFRNPTGISSLEEMGEGRRGKASTIRRGGISTMGSFVMAGGGFFQGNHEELGESQRQAEYGFVVDRCTSPKGKGKGKSTLQCMYKCTKECAAKHDAPGSTTKFPICDLPDFSPQGMRRIMRFSKKPEVAQLTETQEKLALEANEHLDATLGESDTAQSGYRRNAISDLLQRRRRISRYRSCATVLSNTTMPNWGERHGEWRDKYMCTRQTFSPRMTRVILLT